MEEYIFYGNYDVVNDFYWSNSSDVDLEILFVSSVFFKYWYCYIRVFLEVFSFNVRNCNELSGFFRIVIFVVELENVYLLMFFGVNI